MINLVAAQLLSVPQGVKPGMAALPWPDGSVLSAKLTPGAEPGSAILMLGGYRMQAKVPANTPMGNIWLQLVSHETPAQFRLLSDFKAASLLAEMLAGKVTPKEQPTRDASRNGQESGWQKLDSEQLPFRTDSTADGQRLMLRDREDDSPRGVVHAAANEHRFLLRGRADLDHLGPVAFALEGSGDRPWTLKLYAGRDASVAELRPAFVRWLQQQSEQDSPSQRLHVEGHLFGGFPEQYESLENLTA